MNRRFFVTGAAALAGASALKLLMNESFAGGDQLPAQTGCLYPPDLIHNAQTLMTQMRAVLRANNLLDIPPDIADFFHTIEDRYIAAFGASSVVDDELNEAAMILDDPECYVSFPPNEGCVYYEAWKYFAMRESLAVLPADDSVAFTDLNDAQQYIAVRGVVAYTGMLQNMFPSLIDHLDMSQTINALNVNLYIYSEDMETLLASISCLPPQNTPPTVPRLPSGPTIRLV